MGRYDDDYFRDLDRRRGFDRDMDRRYEDFRDDMTYRRRRREEERAKGIDAMRRGDLLGALAGLGNVDLAPRYADALAQTRQREAPKPFPDRPIYYEAAGLVFFESGDDPWTDAGTPRECFQSSATRYINTRVFIRNPWQASDMTADIRFRYYWPSGDVMGDVTQRIAVPLAYDVVCAQSGWGWPAPGAWQGGRYRVDVMIGKTVLASEHFHVSCWRDMLMGRA